MDEEYEEVESEVQEVRDTVESGNEAESVDYDQEGVVNDDVLSSDSAENIEKDEKISKPRVPSALTVENLKRYEEETDPVEVQELMAKERQESTRNGDSESKEEDVHTPEEKAKQNLTTQRFQDRLENERSPATPFVTRGHKYTGEEYEAVTNCAQTEESWLWQAHSMQYQDPSLSDVSQHPTALDVHSSTTPDTGVQKYDTTEKSPFKRKPHPSKSKHVTSDISTSELIESDEEKLTLDQLKLPQNKKRETSAAASSATVAYSGMSELDTEEDSPVIEVEVLDSEFEEETSTSDTSNTVSSVLPPFILQYKAESKEVVIDYDDIEQTLPHDMNWEDLTEAQREYYEMVVQEMKMKRENENQRLSKKHNLLDIEPHAAYGSRQERKAAKEKAAERMRVRELEKKKESAAAANNQTNFYSFARQLKTVNYSLSSEKCMEEGWTIRPITPVTPLEPAKEYFIQESTSDIVSAKRYQRTFVEKYYDNGQMFLSVFVDGTGTIWYPSGNVAVSFIASDISGKLIYIIQEDKDPDENPDIQAIFEPDGNCTCYYPNGTIRTNLTSFGGEYYSTQGERLKRWKWKDTETHVHAPPFQPITFGLSRQIGVRIIAQESILITFADGRKSVRFNVGTKLRLRRPLPKEEAVDMDALLLQDRIAYTQSLIERIQCTFKFPHSPRRNQIKLPHYLTAKLERAEAHRAELAEKLPPLNVKSKRKSKSLVPEVSASARLPQIRQQKVRGTKGRSRVRQTLPKPSPPSEIMFSVTVN